MANFVEVRPVNPNVTDREWINADQIKAIYQEPGTEIWGLWTVDNEIRIPAHPKKLEAMLDGD